MLRRRTLGLAIALIATGCGAGDGQGDPGTDPCGSAGCDSGTVDGASDGDPLDADTGPSCGDGAWSTYGHDARRTFASDACIAGPLTASWHYAPEPPMGRMFSTAFRAVAQKDAVFLTWSATNPPYLGTTAADRIDGTGKRVWTWDSGTDANVGNWPSIGPSYFAVNDDGLYLLGLADGKKLHDTGVDWWGQTLPDAARLYVVNAMKADGPGLFVGAVDDTTKVLWQQNQHDGCGHGFGDVNGGLALDGGTLFYAPLYQTGGGGDPGFPSGVFAFDAATGTPKWNQTTKPKSAISVGASMVFGVEDPQTLVARAESDGKVVWSKTFGSVQVGAQAPVLANDLVIVATTMGVQAFTAKDGTPAWTANVNAPAYAFPSIITNGCGGNVAMGGALRTTMAAALGSNTLIVAANDGLHVLSLADGKESSKTSTTDGGFVQLHDPIVVGKTVYVVDDKGVQAFTSP